MACILLGAIIQSCISDVSVEDILVVGVGHWKRIMRECRCLDTTAGSRARGGLMAVPQLKLSRNIRFSIHTPCLDDLQSARYIRRENGVSH